MISLSTVREETHNRLLKLRSIIAILKSEEFEELWYAADPSSKSQLTKILLDIDKEALEKWIRTRQALENQSVLHLREEARRLGISGWSRMLKTELVKAIQEQKE